MSKKRDLLFLCQYSYPETVSSATLPFDTATYLAEKGYKVDILCGYPKEYCEDRKVPMIETVDGVTIRRLKYMEWNRKHRIGRIVNYFSFTLKVWLHRSVLKKYDKVIVYSNPPILPIVPLYAAKHYGVKTVFVSYDVYPEIALATGAIRKNSIIDRIMTKLNADFYRTVSCVVALTDEMKTFLLENRTDLTPDRIKTIPNWAHEIPLKRNESRCFGRFGFTENQFIVSYFGNLGTCQDVETMLEAAERLKDNNAIGFFIVGHGNKKEFVETFIEEKKLYNVKVYSFLTGEDFQSAVEISSCCIVSLQKGLKGTCAPSKYYSYLQGGLPVISVTEEGSYLQSEIEERQIGASVIVGDSLNLAKTIEKMAADPEACKAMGDRAHELYKEQYDRAIGLEKYDEMLRAL